MPDRLGWIVKAGIAVVLVACSSDVDAGLQGIRSGSVPPDEAIPQLRRLQRLDPGNAEVDFQLGRLLASEGLPNQAIPPLHRAARSDAFATRAGVALAAILLQTDNPEEAIRVAERVVEREEKAPHARMIIARGQARLRKWDEAIAQADAVLDLDPENREAMLLRAQSLTRSGRREEAGHRWEELETLALESDATDLAVRACLGGSGISLADDLEPEALRSMLNEFASCASKYPGHYEPLRASLRLLVRLRDLPEIDRLLRSSADSYRDDPAHVFDIVLLLREAGGPGEIVEIAEHVAEVSGDARAWTFVEELRRELGNTGSALAAVDRAIESLPGNEELLFTKADILIDAGRSTEAVQLARTLEEPAFEGLIEGRAALVAGEPRRALSTIDSIIGRWPNNAGARVVAARAARQLGDYDRAIEEYRAAFRARASSEVGLEAAAMSLDLGRYGDGLESALWYLKSSQAPTLEALRLTARLALAAGNPIATRTALKRLELEGGALAPRLELARHALDRGGPDGAKGILEAMDPDGDAGAADVLVLDHVELLLAAGLPDRAQSICHVLSERGDSQALAGKVCGRVRLERGEPKLARQDFEKALAVDHEDPVALEGLAVALEMAGERTQAMETYRLATAKGSGADARLALARMLAQSERFPEARAELHQVLRDHPESWRAADELARLLLDGEPDLDEALALARRAVLIRSSPRTADTLTRVYVRRGELDDALATVRSSIETHPDSGALLFRLAEVLLASGARSQAEDALRRSIELGGFSEIPVAKEQLAALGAG